MLTVDLSGESSNLNNFHFQRVNTLKAAADILWDYTLKSLPMSAGRDVTRQSVESDKKKKKN